MIHPKLHQIARDPVTQIWNSLDGLSEPPTNST